MRWLARRLASIFVTGPWEPVEFGIGVFLVIVGGWYWLPFDTFAVSASYAWARSWLPESALGAAMASTGLLAVAAALSANRPARMGAMLATCWMLLFVGLLLNVSSPASAGLSIFGTLAVAPAWAWLRLAWVASWAISRQN